MADQLAAMQPIGAMSRSAKYVSLLLVGIGLPGLLALVNRLILARLSLPNVSWHETVLSFGVYAGQLALVSWAVARYIEPWLLRWFLWIWSMALIDLQLSVILAAESYPTRAIVCLATGVLAAQIGALVVWGILGSGPLLWRLPSLLVLLLVAWNCYGVLVRISRNGSWYQLGWNDLLWVQTMILSAMCGVMRLSGITLAKTPGDSPGTAGSSSDGRSLQFGIRDVLIGTTCLATLLGFAKAGDLLTLQFLRGSYNAGFLFVALAAICTAIVLLVALWASLGQGRVTHRILLLVCASLALGSPIAWYCVHEINAGQAQPLVLWNHRLYSLLVIFRVLGYRLVRKSTRSWTGRRAGGLATLQGGR